MTAYRVTVAELSDLCEVTVICGNCKCRLVLATETLIVPDQCPSCNKVFDDDLKTALGSLNKFFVRARQSKSKVEFAIRDKVI
jgi:Zn-finger nucleic acid-binding protein